MVKPRIVRNVPPYRQKHAISDFFTGSIFTKIITLKQVLVDLGMLLLCYTEQQIVRVNLFQIANLNIK